MMVVTGATITNLEEADSHTSKNAVNRVALKARCSNQLTILQNNLSIG